MELWFSMKKLWFYGKKNMVLYRELWNLDLRRKKNIADYQKLKIRKKPKRIIVYYSIFVRDISHFILYWMVKKKINTYDLFADISDM